MCGLRHESIQKRPLADNGLTSNIACDVAHAMELAVRDTLELSGKPATATMDVHRLATARNQVNRFAETRQNGGQSPARRKQPSNDPVRKQAARAHVAVSSMMPEHAHSEKQTAMAVTASDTCIKCVANTHFVGEEGSEFCGDSALGIHHITECGSGDGNDVSVITLGQRKPTYMVTVDVAGQNICMETDTGAVVSVVSESWYREHLTRFALEPTQLQLRDYQGGSYRLRG